MRILDISFKHKLSHIGSCLTALPIIQEIYQSKKDNDVFVLSSGHAGLALYVVLEEKYGINAETLFLKHGVHPCRDEDNKIYCSTGSLGLGLPIAVGFALANRTTYCLISDGECAEGSIWETLNFKEKYNLTNLKVYVNMNGYSAYDLVDCQRLRSKLVTFCPSINIHFSSNELPFLNGIDAHYHIMNEDEYKSISLKFQDCNPQAH